MASTSTTHSKKDKRTMYYEKLQEVRGRQWILCAQITQKRNYQAALRKDLATVTEELVSLRDEHSTLEIEARRIDKRIQDEPSIPNFHASPENETDDASHGTHDHRQETQVRKEQRSIGVTQPVNDTNKGFVKDSRIMLKELPPDPRDPSSSRTSPKTPSTSKASPLTYVSSTVVDGYEESLPAKISFPTSSSATQTAFSFKSPRNSDSKQGTPKSPFFNVNGMRMRVQSLRSDLSRLPSLLSPAATRQPDDDPDHASFLPRQSRKSSKRL